MGTEKIVVTVTYLVWVIGLLAVAYVADSWRLAVPGSGVLHVVMDLALFAIVAALITYAAYGSRELVRYWQTPTPIRTAVECPLEVETDLLWAQFVVITTADRNLVNTPTYEELLRKFDAHGYDVTQFRRDIQPISA